MKHPIGITCVLLGIGGVLLTDGRDHLARRRVAKIENWSGLRLNDRRHLTFEIFEAHSLIARNLSALAITETELKLMAAAAIIGFRRSPNAG
jgi:hypothetical protein